MISIYKVKKRLFRVLFYFLLYSAIFIIILPFCVMVMGSLMSERELMLNNYPDFHLFPRDYNSPKELFSNYIFLLTESEGAYRAFLNSLKATIPTTFAVVLISALAAYPLSRARIRGKNTILFTFLFASMVPTMAILIPLYIQFVKIGLYDTIFVVILVLTAFILPFSIWIMKGFFDTIPKHIEDAALVDGCSRYRALIKVVLPLTLPGMGAVAVFAFITSWAEFLLPLILTQSKAQLFTAYIGRFVNTEYSYITTTLAVGVISCIPVIILALFFQKLIVRGLIEGAVKG